MRAGWLVFVCAAVGCAAEVDEPAPYSADMYGPCDPFGVVEFTATPVAGSTCTQPAPSRWDTSSTECPHEVHASRQKDGTCSTADNRSCRKPLQLGYDQYGWSFKWDDVGHGELKLTIYSGGPQPRCESTWTLTAR